MNILKVIFLLELDRGWPATEAVSFHVDTPLQLEYR